MSRAVPPALILLLGPPASGKTTLGRRLAAELRCPFYSRDDFKEHLFDVLGWSDRAWSQRLGRASWEVFWHVIETQLAAGQATVVETNFQHPRDSESFRELAGRYPFAVVQLSCVTRGDVLIERHRQRSGSGARHPGHVDHLPEVQAELFAQLARGRAEPLDLDGPVIEVDTTDFASLDHRRLAGTIRRLLPNL